MAGIGRGTKRRPADPAEEEWARVEPFLAGPARPGRRRETDLREVTNAVRHLARTGRGWRMLPKDFPPWRTVCWWFRRFVRLMLLRSLHNIAVMIDRERAGRAASPSAGVPDSQTVKAPAAGTARGHDGAKRTVGRKRHVAVDADGRLPMVDMTAADISDRAGAAATLEAPRRRWPRLERLFADGACDRGRLMDKAAFLDFAVEIVRRIDKEPGFKLLPRRRAVERTFARLTRWRRLVRDHDARSDVSQALSHVALASTPLRRISHRTPRSNGL